MSPKGVSTPTISVITPVFNRSHMIADTIKTVQAQTFGNFEMIIVDDCSSDPIEEVIGVIAKDDPRIRLVKRQTNGGPSGARNTGVEAARGDFIAFLDSDDLWEPTKLDAQLNAVRDCSDPKLVFCVTKTRVIYGGGRADDFLPRRTMEQTESFGSFLYVSNQFAQCSSYFLSTELARQISFDESLRQYEDHLYFLAAGGAGASYVLVDEPLVTWHNDARADRMGLSDSTERGKAFLDHSGQLLTEAESIAFQLRCLGPALAAHDKREALSLVAKAIRHSEIPKEAWVKVLLTGIIGSGNYDRLRSLLSRG